MENLKFHYDEEDKKFATLYGEKVELVRIVADRDIKNPFCDVKAGDLGGYIVRGTLCDEGESWIDENSIVGTNCFVGGNGFVSNSILVHDVRIGGEGAIVDSQINPSIMTTVHACGKIVFTAEDAEREGIGGKGEKVVLVRLETSPEDITGMKASQ